MRVTKKNMSKIMFFIMVLAVIVGANFYVFRHLWLMVPQGNPLRWLILAFGIVAVSSMFISVIFGNHMPQGLTGFLYKLGTSWLFFMIYFAMLFLVADILSLCGAPLKQYMRESWTGLAISVGLVAVVMAAGNIKYHNKKRVELNLTVDKRLPAEGLKIVAVSDLHIGYTIGREELVGWIELINAENPDIVLIAGDVADKRARRIKEDGYAEEFRKIKSKYGVFASLGNHEYINNVDESLDFLSDAGMVTLRDTAVSVGGLFHVAGRDDRTNPRRAELASITAGLDRSLPVILLDHQPYGLEQADRNGIDVQLSGHTHRGQVWPLSWITDAMYAVSHGYKRIGASHIYVSSGLGIWGGKFRIGTQSEYVVINLKGRDRPDLGAARETT